MNFRWNNIYVLQFLMVLDVNALKLVPADRTVIKENGTTHTIARYFVLPNEDKNNLYSAGDAVFSKFLREFDKNNEVKNAQPEKKIVDRYRIYIKRKLKNVNKDVSKFGGNSENTSSTTEAIGKSTIPVKVITYDTPLTEIVTDNNEYIVKKKQLNLNAAFPELQDKKHLQTLESKESLLDVKVRQAEYPEQLIIKRTRSDFNLQDPYEILKTAAASQAQKQQAELQGNQNIDIPQTKVILLMSKGGKIKENTNGGETEEDTIVTIDQDGSPIKLNKPLEALSQVEVNDLYAQLYDKYIPEKSNDSEPDMKIQRQNLNVGVDETAKQVPENLKTGTAIEELSVIHDTPQKYTEQAVTDTILDQYNPSEEKESAGEYKYEGFDELLVYQTHRPPFLEDNYDIATQDSLKSKEIQQLTITDAEYSNNITPRSLLESNYVKYGIQNDSEPEIKIQRQDLNVGVDKTANLVPENLKNGTSIEKSLIIHDTPQKYTEQAVTDTILDQYNPSEEKESAGEYKYEGFDKLLVYQTHRPPFLKDNYDIATQDSVKSKEIQQLTITDAEYSNNFTPRSLLESNYIKYGIQNDSETEIKLQRQDLNVGVNETANLVPENLKNGTAIEKSLIIHDTPQKYTEQAVTDTILDQYNPSEKKESAGEYKYEGFDELLVYQTHRPPFLEDNYDIATQDSVKSKEIQQLTITSANYSDTKPTSLLESNYIKYGIPDDSEPEKIIQRQELNIGVDETAKYVQENLKNKTAIEQLSVIHDTPQKYTEQAVTDTILDQYNPSEEKESTGEYKYEGFDELLVYQTHRPPFLRDSYDITTQDAVKSKEKSKSNLLTPVLNDVPAGDYLKTPRSPNSVNTNLSLANDDAKYKFSTADILPTTKNSGSTTISENSTTDDNTLRGGMGDEWTTVYQEVGVNDKQYPSQPNIKIATNLVQIGAEDEVESYHAPNTFDLATVCPKCFQKIRAEPIHKLETTGTDEVDASVTGNTQLSSLYSQLLAQQQQGGDGSGSIWSILSLLSPTLLISGLSSLLSSINPEDILELMQNLNTQKQQVHLNPEVDQTLLKILEIVMELKDSVLKDSDAKFSTNLEEAGAAIFTIQNLRNVLEALENRIEIQPDIDRETANLYVIIKIIFDTAMKQTQVAIANEQENSEEIWYKQLTAYRANPIMSYVYNLIRQTWLQEIMFELYYNNYNLNVIRNRRWADYLRAWHLPIYLVKYINADDNYDQNEYTDQYVNDDYIQKVYYFQNDANVILNFLRNYLIGMQYYEPNTMEYYRKQTEVFSGIAAFMRQRGYSVHVIHNLIQKLYALLNANKTSVTLTRPSCLARQQL